MFSGNDMESKTRLGEVMKLLGGKCSCEPSYDQHSTHLITNANSLCYEDFVLYSLLLLRGVLSFGVFGFYSYRLP